ncbi:MAG: YihY/virulence factor BrkB family protein [Eubacterium sp.]|jgi:membrane protein|nr:YihY/virulence factor BrkB family protein [Eubacterium sp.]MCI9617307.1 YihY/virulence factor BrkB family protein [Eubacterium sp.]
MKKKLLQPILKLYDFCVRMAKDRVGIYTAQASFFIILSIFPFFLLFLNIIGMTSITSQSIINLLNTYAPDTIKPLLIQIIEELYTHVSGTAISIAAIVAIWSASKGVLSVMFGLYEISKIHQNRNYFISRFISMMYTILFVFSIIITMVLLVFGNSIFNFLISLLPFLKEISVLTLILRYLVSFLILSIFFIIIYKIANFKLTTIRKTLPGAMFSSLGWLVFSYVFSIYIDNFSNMSYMYGSLTAFIILMLWIYFCIYILFIGAEINKKLYPETEAKFFETRNIIEESF